MNAVQPLLSRVWEAGQRPWQGRTQDFRRGGGGAERRGGGAERGGGPRSAKEANNPNKHATELKSCTCAHQGSIFRP